MVQKPDATQVEPKPGIHLAEHEEPIRQGFNPPYSELMRDAIHGLTKAHHANLGLRSYGQWPYEYNWTLCRTFNCGSR